MPELDESLTQYWLDYSTLARFAGAERVSISEVYAFATHNGIGDDYLNDLLQLIPDMDDARLKFLAEKSR